MFGWLFGKKRSEAGGATETRELFSLSRTVSAPPDGAFAVFADQIAEWWPRDYSWAKDNLDTIVIEARMRGRCFERSKDGSVAVWGTVLACDRPNHLVFAWQIRPDRSPEPEEGAASRVDIRFVAVAGGKTEVVLVHRDFPRHGDGWEQYKTQMAAKGGWPRLLDLYKTAADKLAASPS
jgi:uncharacterized protein YndB with AHSA1/START domain